jgi:hypothetical protein
MLLSESKYDEVAKDNKTNEAMRRKNPRLRKSVPKSIPSSAALDRFG